MWPEGGPVPQPLPPLPLPDHLPAGPSCLRASDFLGKRPKQSTSMDYGRQKDFVLFHAINQAVAVNKPLSNACVANLWNHPANIRKI